METYEIREAVKEEATAIQTLDGRAVPLGAYWGTLLQFQYEQLKALQTISSQLSEIYHKLRDIKGM